MDSLACRATGQGNGQLLRDYLDEIGESPPKKMRSASREKELLVAIVNSFMQLGEDQRHCWIRHAELHHGGISDPSQHQLASLQLFCTFHGLQPRNAPVLADSLGPHNESLPRAPDTGTMNAAS